MHNLVALWISTCLQNFITLCCLVLELRDLEENLNKTLYIKTPCIYAMPIPIIYEVLSHLVISVVNFHAICTLCLKAVLVEPCKYQNINIKMV